MKTYFAIIGTSRYACGGQRWSLTASNTEDEIIGFAEEECNRSGANLCELVGIGMEGVNEDEDGDFEYYEPDRQYADGEHLVAAIEKLNDDGRDFLIYDDSDTVAIQAFIDKADFIGCGDKARELVVRFCNRDLWTDELIETEGVTQ